MVESNRVQNSVSESDKHSSETNSDGIVEVSTKTTFPEPELSAPPENQLKNNNNCCEGTNESNESNESNDSNDPSSLLNTITNGTMNLCCNIYNKKWNILKYTVYGLGGVSLTVGGLYLAKTGTQTLYHKYR